MRWLSLALLGLCCGQAWASNEAYSQVMLEFHLPERINPQQFITCTQHGCAEKAQVSFSAAQWLTIETLFTPAAASAREEREQIARAIGQMEHLVADFANSHHDKAGDFNGFTAGGAQLDCVDESINTTTYLTLFEQAGLLRWHKVLPRASRGYFFFGGWPHFTAVVETTRGPRERWVIDSWFRDNGVDADVLTLEQWKDGWAPEGFSM